MQSTVQQHESLYQFQHYIFLLFVSILILFLPLLEPHSTGGDGDGDGDDDLADQYMRYVLVRSRHFRTFLLSDP